MTARPHRRRNKFPWLTILSFELYWLLWKIGFIIKDSRYCFIYFILPYCIHLFQSRCIIPILLRLLQSLYFCVFERVHSYRIVRSPYRSFHISFFSARCPSKFLPFTPTLPLFFYCNFIIHTTAVQPLIVFRIRSLHAHRANFYSVDNACTRTSALLINSRSCSINICSSWDCIYRTISH